MSKKHIPLKKRLRIKLHSDKIGKFIISPTIDELFAFSDVVFPDEKLLDAMETGYLYDYGISSLAIGTESVSFLVKLYMDRDTPPTSKREPDHEHAVCLVIPSDILLSWTNPKGE